MYRTIVGNLNEPQSLNSHKLHEMPGQKGLDTAGPFVHCVLDVDGWSAGRVGIAAVQYLGATVIERHEIIFREITVRNAVKELVTGCGLLGRLQRDRVEIRIYL